jgi:hypothetical protein
LSRLLDEIAAERLPRRERRRNQRAVKRKMSNYPIRSQPSQDASHERITIVRKH